MTPGTLLYPSAGVLTQEGDFNDNRPILNAFLSAPDTVTVTMMSGQTEDYTIQPNTLQSEGTSIVTFMDSDDQKYQIRPINDTDGEWLSGLHTQVPAAALRSLVTDSNPKGSNSAMSVYLKDKRESMVAFQYPDDDYLFGLLYINKFGAYVRLDQSWIAVPPTDDTFDETYPYDVNADSVDDFIAAWDQGPVNVQDAESKGWITAPENDGQEPDQDETDAEPDSEPDLPENTDD